MGAHGVLRYQKALSDLGVRKAFREQFKGLQLPVRQRLDEHRIIGRLQGPSHLLSDPTALADARDSPLDIVSVSEWLIRPHGSTRYSCTSRSTVAPSSAKFCTKPSRAPKRKASPTASHGLPHLGRWHAALRPSTAADATRAGGAERSARMQAPQPASAVPRPIRRCAPRAEAAPVAAIRYRFANCR